MLKFKEGYKPKINTQSNFEGEGEPMELDVRKILAAKLIEIINNAFKSPWQDTSPYIKLLDFLEKGYNLNQFQINRIELGYELLIDNEFIKTEVKPELENTPVEKVKRFIDLDEKLN